MLAVTLKDVFPSTSFWGQLSEKDRADLTDLGSTDTIPPGEKIIRQRGHAYSVLVILRGHVVVVSEARAPAESDVLIAWRGAGDIVGELAAITRTPRSATVKAIEELEFLEVDGSVFIDYLRGHFEAHMALDRVLAQRSADLAAEVRSERRKVPARVARVLAEAADRVGRPSREGVWVPYPLTQGDLAGLIGVTRESVSAALKQFGGRVVTTRPKRIIIHDLDALRKAAEEAD
jgi:CRP/FNR family transcriptional regulator, cyclic AMP receptor protein